MMTTTLTYASTTLPLPDDLLWPDEFGWAAVEQRTQYSILGALVVEAAAKQAGRPITLQAGDDYAWMDRATLLTLFAWSKLPGQSFTLDYRGDTYTVAFDHQRGAIEALPVHDVADPTVDDFYAATLRFITL